MYVVRVLIQRYVINSCAEKELTQCMHCHGYIHINEYICNHSSVISELSITGNNYETTCMASYIKPERMAGKIHLSALQ